MQLPCICFRQIDFYRIDCNRWQRSLEELLTTCSCIRIHFRLRFEISASHHLSHVQLGTCLQCGCNWNSLRPWLQLWLELRQHLLRFRQTECRPRSGPGSRARSCQSVRLVVCPSVCLSVCLSVWQPAEWLRLFGAYANFNFKHRHIKINCFCLTLATLASICTTFGTHTQTHICMCVCVCDMQALYLQPLNLQSFSSFPLSFIALVQKLRQLLCNAAYWFLMLPFPPHFCCISLFFLLYFGDYGKIQHRILLIVFLWRWHHVQICTLYTSSR